MLRKLLFVVFSPDDCRIQHAFRYALDLVRHGHEVRVVLEGEATAKLREREGRFGDLLRAALTQNLVAGVCASAARGCASGDTARDVTGMAKELELPLLDDLEGHAGIEPFVREGFEVVTF